MPAKKALILVDLQNDFCQGGKLAVPGGDEIIPLANRLQACFDVIIATQDWHPQDHMSFAVNHPGQGVGDMIVVDDIPQVLWPEHCVQHSKGAEFHPDFDTHKVTKIIHKGVEKKIDSYSAFYDNAHRRSTGLRDYLQEMGIQEVYIAGLATDYCVKYSALDAAHAGFTTYVIADACRGVELNPGDIAHAFAEMREAGVSIIQFNDVMESAAKTGS